MDITWLHIHDNLAPDEQYLNMANVFHFLWSCEWALKMCMVYSPQMMGGLRGILFVIVSSGEMCNPLQ
jgi:hypothetical protein